MAVFRIEKTRDYTVMSNHHLRNAGLSLKSKGLLSMMLSLPEDWNYTTRGLAKICKEGTDSICARAKGAGASRIRESAIGSATARARSWMWSISSRAAHTPDNGPTCGTSRIRLILIRNTRIG